MTPQPRILIVDDNAAIHEDFRKILGGTPAGRSRRAEMENLIFGAAEAAPQAPTLTTFRLDFATQGQEAFELVKAALAANDPYCLVFMDVRMPPGWDGIETLEHIRPIAPGLQAVLCTAFSDYSWEGISRRLGPSDSLLILKKPFETIEVLQLAHALTQKWQLAAQARLKLQDLDRMVQDRTRELVAANEKLREEIVERARMQEALRHSEERFATAFRASPMPMAILKRPAHQFLDANPRFLDLCGLPAEALLQQTAPELNLWSDHTTQRLSSIAVGQHLHSHPCTLHRGDATNRETVLWAEPIGLDTGPCLLLIAEDVTDQLKLESQLRQAQKMEAVGRLAAGIAHEFNNLLTVIQGHADLMRDMPHEPRMVSESGSRICKASQRAASLTRQLLAFSRKQALQLKPVNLSEVVNATQKMLNHLLGERYEIKIACAESVAPTLADVGSLEQVMINLAVNARDAMPGGGTILLSTGQTTFTEATARRIPDARPGRCVHFTVTDSGCGMSKETLARIFDPFFTTKDIGKGTGLGLSIIHGIVRQHRGCIAVASEIGVGSSFTVYLPVFAGEESTARFTDEAASAVPRTGQGEAVLVVEDEAAVRDLARATLERGGYRVLEAADAESAIEVWGLAPAPVAVLVTDMVLPGGITGGKLAQILQARDARLRTICISGYGSETIKDDLPRTLIPGINFLPKPFEPNALLKAVNTAIAGTASSADHPPVLAV